MLADVSVFLLLPACLELIYHAVFASRDVWTAAHSTAESQPPPTLMLPLPTTATSTTLPSPATIPPSTTAMLTATNLNKDSLIDDPDPPFGPIGVCQRPTQTNDQRLNDRSSR